MEGIPLLAKEPDRGRRLSVVSEPPPAAISQPGTVAIAERHLIRPSLDSAAGRQAIGHRAAVAGDFDTAELAFLRAANDYRESGQPLFEVFALVELAAVYHLQNRRERLPVLARRVEKIAGHEMLSSAHSAIVRLALELIESAPDDPVGLEMFTDCWPREVEGVTSP